MTVCVVTISNNGVITGAADRMLSLPTKQAEPPGAKIFHLVSHPVTILWAGNAAIQAELLQTVANRLAANPQAYPHVENAAAAYCDAFRSILAKRASAEILQPLGLTAAALVAPKSEIDRDMQHYLVERVISYCLPPNDGVGAIIAGVDDTGTHVWTIQNGYAACRDIEGFATIGVGWDHADSQLRFSGFSRFTSPPVEAAILTHFAKKRAEVAPGVGKITDMFMRDAVNRQWLTVPPDWIEKFDSFFAEVVAGETRGLKTAVSRAAGFFESLVQQIPTPPPTGEPRPTTQTPPTSADRQ